MNKQSVEIMSALSSLQSFIINKLTNTEDTVVESSYTFRDEEHAVVFATVVKALGYQSYQQHIINESYKHDEWIVHVKVERLDKIRWHNTSTRIYVLYSEDFISSIEMPSFHPSEWSEYAVLAAPYKMFTVQQLEEIWYKKLAEEEGTRYNMFVAELNVPCIMRAYGVY